MDALMVYDVCQTFGKRWWKGEGLYWRKINGVRTCIKPRQKYLLQLLLSNPYIYFFSYLLDTVSYINIYIYENLSLQKQNATIQSSTRMKEQMLVLWEAFQCNTYIHFGGRRVIGISRSLIWSKSLMELIFNPCGEFRWSPEGPVSQIHSPHVHVAAPGNFSDLLRSVQMVKRVWGEESNGKLQHLFIASKTAILVPEFAMEDLPLGRIAALVSQFAVKDLTMGRTLMMIYIPTSYSEIHIINFLGL